MDYKEFFERALELGLTNIQVTEKHTIDSSVEIINGKIESFDDYDNADYNIKAEKGKKTVKVTANVLNEELLKRIIENIDSTDSVYEDEYLEGIDSIPSNKPLEFDISKEIQILKEVEEIRKKYPQVEKTTSYFGENYTNTRIINSNGVDISSDSHLCNLTIEAIVKVGEEYTSFNRNILTTNKKEINFLEFAEDVLEKAILQSNREKCETKKYDIVLDSNVAGRILSKMINMISAQSIRKKTSCFENKLEEQIFHKDLTIIEDPANKDYPGYRLFDDEGTKTKKKTIVENGVLKTYLYDIKEAKLKDLKSTGNGYQGIRTRNMIIVPKEKSQEELFHSMKDGIYIVDFMGASGTSINTVTGTISLQVFGFLVKDGKIVSGIEPSVMTTTIFELFSNIKEIGNDLIFTQTPAASPSLWIKDISIAR